MGKRQEIIDYIDEKTVDSVSQECKNYILTEMSDYEIIQLATEINQKLPNVKVEKEDDKKKLILIGVGTFVIMTLAGASSGVYYQSQRNKNEQTCRLM